MDKQKIPLTRARVIAESLIRRLAPHCERIEIAGSVRRQKAEVGDIEIVAIPKPALDMFGQVDPSTHALNLVDWLAFGKIIKNGNKYKQIELAEGVNLDLFIVTPPAQWGVVFIIRTGPADYSRRFVTSKRSSGPMPGLMPSNLKVKDGAIWHGLTLIETPEERDVYKLIGLPWVAPEMRTA